MLETSRVKSGLSPSVELGTSCTVVDSSEMTGGYADSPWRVFIKWAGMAVDGTGLSEVGAKSFVVTSGVAAGDDTVAMYRSCTRMLSPEVMLSPRFLLLVDGYGPVVALYRSCTRVESPEVMFSPRRSLVVDAGGSTLVVTDPLYDNVPTGLLMIG